MLLQTRKNPGRAATSSVQYYTSKRPKERVLMSKKSRKHALQSDVQLLGPGKYRKPNRPPAQSSTPNEPNEQVLKLERDRKHNHTRAQCSTSNEPNEQVLMIEKCRKPGPWSEYHAFRAEKYCQHYHSPALSSIPNEPNEQVLTNTGVTMSHTRDEPLAISESPRYPYHQVLTHTTSIAKNQSPVEPVLAIEKQQGHKHVPAEDFTCFLNLPAELQIMIIREVLAEEIQQRNDKLLICGRRCPPQEEPDSNKPQPWKSRFIVQLPKLPAVYHTNRLFRTEALFIQPLHQLLPDDTLPSLSHRLGSNVLFDPSRDTVAISLRNYCASDLMMQTVLSAVFALTEKTSPGAASIKVAFIIGPKAYGPASELHANVLAVAQSFPQFLCRSRAELVREKPKGKKGVWQVNMEFGLDVVRWVGGTAEWVLEA